MTVSNEWDDVSHFQGEFQPSRFTVAKATEGSSYSDPMYDGIKARAAAGKHHFAGYHFLREGNAAAQAAWAHRYIGSVPAMLDIETEGSSTPSLSDVVNFVKAYRSLKGVMNVLYLPHWYWANEWKSVSLAPLKALGLHVINSDYSHGKASNSPGFDAYGGIVPFALQYTSKPHDLNIAYMSFEETWSIWTGKPPTAVKPHDHLAGSRMLQLASPNMHGYDVSVVQHRIGVRHAGKPDGVFGPNTSSGVKWWQKQHRLVADGIVGPKTWTSMGIKWIG